jgi:hypothetical protein
MPSITDKISAGQLTQLLSDIGQWRVVPAYDAVHESITVRPQPVKPAVSRVVMLAPAPSAVAAISASNVDYNSRSGNCASSPMLKGMEKPRRVQFLIEIEAVVVMD